MDIAAELPYNISVSKILRNVDVLIEGLYKEELRDTSLLLRGSSNQRIFRKRTIHHSKWMKN